MKYSIFISCLLPTALAYPWVFDEVVANKRAESYPVKRADNATQAISQAETNCGPTPCTTFSATEQFVSTTGQYAYQSPAANQIRGPCPGLNAAANHGYISRSGIVGIPDTITGLGKAYGIGADFAGFLAAYAVVFDGDIVSQTWSIGGPQPVNVNLGYNPQGISYSHNKYEGDTSIGRNDAYLDNGDAHSLNVTRFAQAFASGMSDDSYTLDKFRQVSGENQYFSIRNNPYYFAPLFATTIVAPAAYNFVINFMSNHSAEQPSGYLNGDIFKTFFAVSGEYPNFTWNRGQERIPNNWYRRPTANAYGAPPGIADLVIGWAAYPNTFRFGGNTNGVNTYQGVDISKMTNGSYELSSLFQGDNFACLFFQTQQQAVPDELKGIVNDVATALSIFDKYVNPVAAEFKCSPLAGYDNSVFNVYPGRTYSPTGPATNY